MTKQTLSVTAGGTGDDITRKFLWYQGMILAVLWTLAFLNEAIDLPSRLFGMPPSSSTQRWGEMAVEMGIYTAIVAMEIWIIQKLRRDLRVLQGLLPMCAGCKKIRDQGRWEPVEQFISTHSHAEFTHGLCPDCLRERYPEVAETVLREVYPTSAVK